MVFVGVVAASAAGRGGATNFLAAASPAPSPGFKSNETASPEATEPAARETAENNGTATFGHDETNGSEPARPDGASGGSNEDPTHEANEGAARKAAEKEGSTTPAAPQTPTTTPAPTTTPST